MSLLMGYGLSRIGFHTGFGIRWRVLSIVGSQAVFILPETRGLEALSGIWQHPLAYPITILRFPMILPQL